MQEPGAAQGPIHLAVNEGGMAPLAQFFIPAAASLQERRPRTLKHGDTFAVFDHNGDTYSGPGSPEGIYHRDTRHLSHLYLTIDDMRPMLLSSTLRDDNATLTCDLTNPDLFDADGKIAVEHDLVHLRRTRFLWNGTCYERITVRNFDVETRRFRLALAFAADFADLFEVRGSTRENTGVHHPASVADHGVSLSYTGLDDRRRTTRLCFEPKPTSLTADLAVFEMELAPRERRPIFLEIRCSDGDAAPVSGRVFYASLRAARRALRASAARASSVATSNDIFNESVRRSISDIYTLVTQTPEGPYPYAGIPWFSTVFGRDALITAHELLWIDPTIARGVLAHLAANQATDNDPAADAEPGKILHEVRQGEMAILGEVPFRRYYGSIDSTPLFLTLAGAYHARTGDLDFMRGLWPHIEAAIDWMERYGDRDGDGFIEYHRQTAKGLANQGWKDSHDSIFHADGTLAKGPVALVEVQAYAYGALCAAADIAHALERTERAAELASKAEALRRRFDEAFFDEALGTYVLALDGEKRPCRVRASNAGHALFTGIALSERAPPVIRSLMNGSSFSGWGVRTLASTEARYNPMSYHNGSVWPHDNAIIAAGFARYGFHEAAGQIFEGIFDASARIDLRRLPELFCGFPRHRSRGPTFYPVACSPQAWAAAAPLSLLQSSLGIAFDPVLKQITFNEPLLPRFLDEVILRGLSLDGATVDVALKRAGTKVAVHILERRGEVRVLTVS